MPTDLIKRIDLDLIYPGLLAPFLETLAACRARGHDYFAISGMRTFAEQAKLYFQGRTAPGKKVTNAQPGYSFHNYGLAIDCAHDLDRSKPGLQPDWEADKYTVLREEGVKRGLQVGVPSIKGGDPGHVQLPLGRILKMQEVAICHLLKASHGAGGLKAVWAAVEKMLSVA